MTRSFPASLKKDLRQLCERTTRGTCGRRPTRRGILASIAADQLMLNDRDGVVRTFQRIELVYGKELSGTG